MLDEGTPWAAEKDIDSLDRIYKRFHE